MCTREDYSAEIFGLWKDPCNRDVIINAIPIEEMSLEELIHDHFNLKVIEMKLKRGWVYLQSQELEFFCLQTKF